ncbi:MAG TPA: four helix bundle protein [Pyrinomonadaceae bacterium]|nr:four helix bundle protein [Pyrinomonadaceae bacterium]
MLKSYRELLVWQKAIELTVLVYRLTEVFPKREVYGLAAQLRRAAVSIPSNIAEGYGRGSRKEYLQFLSIAQGSLKELETQIILAQRLTYSTQSQAERILSEAETVGKMLGGLIRSLKAKDA